MSAQILVTKPKALSSADKAILRESGVVVIETNSPKDVRFLIADKPPLDSNDLFRAAMFAIADSSYVDTKEKFAKNLALFVKANDANKTEQKP